MTAFDDAEMGSDTMHQASDTSVLGRVGLGVRWLIVTFKLGV